MPPPRLLFCPAAPPLPIMSVKEPEPDAFTKLDRFPAVPGEFDPPPAAAAPTVIVAVSILLTSK